MFKNQVKLAASLICADPINLQKDIEQLNLAEIDLIHFDVMDGAFVPRYGLYPEILSSLKKVSNAPVDVHMMVNNPDDYIADFQKAGATYYNVHVEVCPHIHRTIKKIKDSGMKAGVGLNPGTSLSSLDWIINDIEMVVLMAINPGIVGHKLIPNMLEKIKKLREYANANGNNDLIIEIDGGVTFDSAIPMIEAGADALVCGTGTIFRPAEDSISNKINLLRSKINHGL